MNPINLDASTQHLNGLGALWAGEQQQMAMNESTVNQRNTLEQIMTAQQAREHASQMQPFKLDEAKLKLEDQQLKNQKAKSDITAANLSQFTDAVYEDVISQGNMQGPPDTLANGTRWAAQAKAMGLDPEDPRVRVILGTAAQGPQGLAKVKEALYRMSAKGQEKTDDRLRQEGTDAAAGVRNTADNTSRERQAHITGGYSVQRAQIQAAARAKAEGKKQSILQMTKGDPIKTVTALVTEGNLLLSQGKHDEAQALFEASNDPVLRAAYNNAAANAGKLTINPETGQLATTGASNPLPQTRTDRGGGGGSFPPAPGTPPAANPAAAAPAAAPPAATKPPPQIGAKGMSNGKPVTWDGTGWKFD